MSAEIQKTKKSDIDIVHKTEDKFAQFQMHIHDKYEIYFSRCSGNKFFVGSKIYECNKNDVFLFDNSDVHKIGVATGEVYDRYVVMFDQNVAQPFDFDGKNVLNCFDKRVPGHSHKISLSDENAEIFLGKMNEMLELNNPGIFAAHLKQKLMLINLLIFLNEQSDLQNKKYSFVDSNPAKESKITEIIYFINQNFASPLSLDMIAKTFFLNKHYLCRLFKTEAGFGVNEYIQSCRLSYSISLLNKGMQVSEAAYKSGFGSDTYFISTFKKAIGMSPKKYSQKVSGDGNKTK